MPSLQIECPNYGFTSTKIPNDPVLEQKCVNSSSSLDKEQFEPFIPNHRLAISARISSDLGSNQSREDAEVEETQAVDWSDFTETQLEEVVLNYFDIIMKSAIKKISSCGYSVEAAMEAIMRSGICYGRKDTLSNIVDNTLAFLRNEQGIDSKKYKYFNNLQQLERYILAEMVCLVRHVRPSFSIGDATWCLLICDVNVSHACAMEYDPLRSSGNSEAAKTSVSTVSKLESKTNSCVRSMLKLSVSRSDNPNISHACAMEYDPLRSSGNSEAAETTSVSTVSKLESKTNSCVRSTLKLNIPNVSHACAMEYDPLRSSGNSETTETSSVSTVLKLESKTNSCLRSTPKLNILRSNNPNSLFHCPRDSQSENHNMGRVVNSPGGKSCASENGNPISSTNHVNGSSAFTFESPVEGEKCEVGKKCHTNSSKKVSARRQKSVHLERINQTYGAKGAFRVVKHSNLGGLVMDKKCVSVSDSTAANVKNSSIKLSREVRVDTSQAGETPKFSLNGELPCNSDFNPKMFTRATESPRASTELSLSLSSKNSGVSESNCNVEMASISFSELASDEIFGQWVPHNNKYEMLVNLGDRVRELQTQGQEWMDWGQQKVMQAANRLSQDKAELKMLRQEKEEVARLKKEKQNLEENTLKKLSEMENALCKASSQVERATAAIQRLEEENIKLRNEMIIARLRVAESVVGCEEVSRREKMTSKGLQSLEKQMALLKEELVNEKRKMSQLQRELEQAQKLHEQNKVRWRRKEKAKDEALMWLDSVRKEMEQIEALAKSKEDGIRLNAESNLSNHMGDIRRLEKEIAELRLKNDSTKIAALSWSLNGSNASRLPSGRSICLAKETYICIFCKAENFQKVGIEELQRERECVMCLSEEKSVIFLPCAHQVVCTGCNKLHEKQGMKNCPSCRTPILRRICVRFADS